MEWKDMYPKTRLECKAQENAQSFGTLYPEEGSFSVYIAS